MPKQTLSGNEARAALLRGVDLVANAVKVTLGPRGRNVLLSRPGQPKATRDGVTVAKEVSNLPDPFENIGAAHAREVADAAVVEAGDGTTTATVILQSIVQQGLKLIDAGAEPLMLADGIRRAATACAEFITNMAIPATPELVRQCAIISTHGDVELGTIIAEATCKVGANGALDLQSSRDEHTTIEHMEGYYFERGWYPNQGFANDRSGKRCVLENPLILISERMIVGGGLKQMPNGQLAPISGDGIGPLLMLAVKARRPLLIVAEDLVGDALSMFVANIEGGQAVGGCFVKLPGFGEFRGPALEDLRIATGAKRIHSQTSTNVKDVLSSFTLDDLGFCERAVITPNRTVLIHAGANEMVLNKRIGQLIEQSQEAENPFQKEHLDHRIARLTGGVAVLRVGGKSEFEVNEKKDRAEDAIHACRGALQEGVVQGGGMALMRAAVLNEGDDPVPTDDVARGVEILCGAIMEPAKQIMRNGGWDAEAPLKIISPRKPSIGYDAAVGKVVDLYKAGIVDPAKVVLTALTKAASIGALLLTTEVLVCDLPEPPK